MPPDPARSPTIDALKALACQIIVLHHLAFYGPMSDVAFSLAPDLLTGFSRYGRMGVQVFLVIGGFLAAKYLLVGDSFPFWKTIGKRYLRLAIPYLVALIIAILAAALARAFMAHHSIPAPPSFDQFLLHLLFMQDILGIEALSAGIWYVAIDFQLFFVTLLVIKLCQILAENTPSYRLLSMFLLVVLGLVSLFYFNLDKDWDNFFVYFIVYYVIGIVSYLLALNTKKLRYIVPGILLMGVTILIALSIDFRERLIVAFCTAIILIISFKIKGLYGHSGGRLLNFLGRISYSVFLIHFPVCLVINALFHRLAPDNPWINFSGIAIAWSSSMVLGALFFHYVEKTFLEKVFRHVLLFDYKYRFLEIRKKRFRI